MLKAGEGMWIPLLLQSMNEGEMHSMGLKLKASDIYDVNKGSLKDAIVSFGGFCTSEIISPNGLLLTNHHCGYGQIQSHSTLENNFLLNGFWAKNYAEEKPNPGLTATLIVRIEDVTAAVLAGVGEGLSPKDRQSLIDKNLNAVLAGVKKEEWEGAMIRPFYKGNQYFLFVTVTYRDVRLVGTPPDAIGKFGADTDNWVWPRHTGDFSLFRIYAGPDNKPADYSPNNVPYKPKHFLPISMDGVTDGDFTMVFGFPGRTDEYLSSHAVKQTMEVLDPTRIAVRDRALAVIGRYMRQDPLARIQYAAKQARIANAWKKWQGEVLGLKFTNALQKKKDYEMEFTSRLDKNAALKNQYGNLLPQLETLYRELEPQALITEYYREVLGGANIETWRITAAMRNLVRTFDNQGEAGYRNALKKSWPDLEALYKDYRTEVEREIMASLLDLYFPSVPASYTDGYPREQLNMDKGDFTALVNRLFSATKITQPESLKQLLDGPPAEAVNTLREDPMVKFFTVLVDAYANQCSPVFNELNGKIEDLNRQYMAAQMAVFKEKKFYPDANGTLRITYGKVEPYRPRDGVQYFTKTYLNGIMEKYIPGDYEFDVPEKLRTLHATKDYGPYAENGDVPVCFIGSNHTTGGNSGSPALDAYGNLIGLNFDRVWEGTMSDINYDIRLCRNIMVDARYILFIIDKYAGAGHLVQEMKLVHPKKKQVPAKKAPAKKAYKAKAS